MTIIYIYIYNRYCKNLIFTNFFKIYFVTSYLQTVNFSSSQCSQFIYRSKFYFTETLRYVTVTLQSQVWQTQKKSKYITLRCFEKNIFDTTSWSPYESYWPIDYSFRFRHRTNIARGELGRTLFFAPSPSWLFLIKSVTDASRYINMRCQDRFSLDPWSTAFLLVWNSPTRIARSRPFCVPTSHR